MNQSCRFWHRSVDSCPVEERTPGWRVRALVSNYETDFGRLSAYYGVMDPGVTPHPPHRHDEHEIFIIRAGALEFRYGDESFVATARSVFYTPPAGALHNSSCASPEAAEFFIIKWRDRRVPSRNDGPCTPFFWSGGLLGGRCSTDPSFQSAGSVALGGDGRIDFMFCQLSGQNRGRLHVDRYNSLVAVLEGHYADAVAPVSAPALIFYAAGVPHGMATGGLMANLHLVMAFHGPSSGETSS